MKRAVILFIIIVLFIQMSHVKVLAEQENIKVSINEKQIEFNSASGTPFVDENGRIQVPFRKALETFGAKVDWDNSTKTAIAEKDGIIVQVPLGANYIFKNGRKLENDTAALSKDGKIYLPIRKVMEAFGCFVGWNTKTNSVAIEYTPNKSLQVYKIPNGLGLPKLSKEEVDALVGQEPVVIQSKISTVPDLLQYMISSKYEDVSGDTQLIDGGIEWHFNRPGESTLRVNKGNCGATANLANYLLKDDYEEVGIINFSADSRQGGHVYNYVKSNGKYYFVDFLQYAMSDYKRYNYRILELDRLEDYASYCIRDYGNSGEKFQIKIIVAYMAENQLPIGSRMSGDEIVMRFFPKGNHVKVLYETPSEGKVVEFIDGPTREPNWSN